MIVLITFLLILSGCTQQEHTQLNHFERPLPVSVGEVIQQDVPIYVETIGHVAAANQVDVRPQVGGTIIDTFIQGGERVKAGDYLYRIDPLPYVLALERAQANLLKDQAQLEYAKSRLGRYSRLADAKFVSKLVLEEYKSNVQAQEAQVLIDKAEIETAKINLNYATVVAPIDGKISLTKVDKGNVVAANDSRALITILQMDPISVNFSLSQKDFQDLQNVLREGNRKFKVLLPYGSRKEVEGDVEALDNRISLETGTIEMKGSVDNPQEILWPGEFVRVQLFLGLKKQASLVPSSAVQVGQKGSYVYVLKPDMTVEQVFVKTGKRIEDLIVIDEGLEPGTKVVTDGQINLRSGAKVVIPGQQQQLEHKAAEGEAVSLQSEEQPQ